MASGTRRITIGFQGGQVLDLRVSDEELKALEKALGRRLARGQGRGRARARVPRAGRLRERR